MKKKILSIILALIMVLGVIPFAGLSAFAAGSVPENIRGTFKDLTIDSASIKDWAGQWNSVTGNPSTCDVTITANTLEVEVGNKTYELPFKMTSGVVTTFEKDSMMENAWATISGTAEQGFTLSLSDSSNYFDFNAEYKPTPTPTGDSVSYIDENGEGKTVTATKLTGDSTSWSGWVYADGEVTISQDVTLASDEVNLILADGASLTVLGSTLAKPAIIGGGKAFNIYAQTNETGKLSVKGINSSDNTAGAGYGVQADITVYSGIVDITGGNGLTNSKGQGKGGGDAIFGSSSVRSSLDVYGGKVTVTGGTGGDSTSDMYNPGAAGRGMYNTTLAVYGGEVTVASGNSGNCANTSRGCTSSNGIYGGNVSVSGSGKLTVIVGTAFNKDGNCAIYNDVTLSGGELTVTGGDAAGDNKNGGIGIKGTLTATGGTATIKGGNGTGTGTGGKAVGGTVTAEGATQIENTEPKETAGGTLTLSFAPAPTPTLETLGALQDAINAAPGDGTTPATETTTIQLTQDLTAPDGAISITIPNGKDITLDLNGKVLNANGKCGVINVKEGGKLSIIDSLPETEHKGYIDANGLWQLGEPQNSETAKNLTGGVITGGNGINGGGIYNLGTVNMYGGNIAGNTVRSDTTTPLGGGVYNSGTFTMYGGNITGNTASSNSKVVFGGGVYNSGTFTMKNGHIDGNTAHSDTGNANGGGVYNTQGTFMMENGSISNNTAHSDTGNANGGGVYNTQGTFTMEDGSISGNTATSTSDVTGGGVFMYAGTFTMKKGAIDENTAHSTNGSPQGGGVALGTKSCVFLMEDGSISNNTSSSDSTSKTVYTGGVDNKGTFIMKNGHIDGNTAYSNYRALGGGLYANGYVGTDDGQTGETIVENGTISNNKAIGKTDALGAGVYVASNKPFTMKNGEISGNVAQSETDAANGGGIFSNGNVTIENGKITGNTADFGGGAYSKGNTFTMKNGEITDNTADYGGGINALAAAKVYLTADTDETVSITGNKANKAVGGVNSLGETHLSGKVSVKDNICTNTYGSQNYPVNLAVAAPIYIDGALTDSEIYVTLADSNDNTHKAGVLTSGFATYNDEVFTYDGPYEMITNADGELEVALSHTHSFTGEYVSNGDGTYSKKCTGCDEVDTENKITVTDYHILSGNCETDYAEQGDHKGAKMGHQNKIGAEGVGRAIICLTQADLEKITEDTVTVVGGDKGKQTTFTLDCAYTYFYAGDTKYEAKDMGYAAFLIIDHNANNEAISGYGYYAVYNGDSDDLIVDALYVQDK